VALKGPPALPRLTTHSRSLSADLRRLKEAFRGPHASHLDLDLGYTDTGAPFLIVTAPEFTEKALIITRGERGWQMHRGGEGPLYEFTSEREVAEFVGSRIIRPRG
jgi:hypothetical protein